MENFENYQLPTLKNSKSIYDAILMLFVCVHCVIGLHMKMSSDRAKQ